MIVRTRCRRCAGEYEFPAGSKTHFCPHCDKQSWNELPASPPIAVKKPLGGTAGLGLCGLGLFGLVLAVDGFFNRSNASSIFQQQRGTRELIGAGVVGVLLVAAALFKNRKMPP